MFRKTRQRPFRWIATQSVNWDKRSGTLSTVHYRRSVNVKMQCHSFDRFCFVCVYEVNIRPRLL